VSDRELQSWHFDEFGTNAAQDVRNSLGARPLDVRTADRFAEKYLAANPETRNLSNGISHVTWPAKWSV
jgi:hypothetical protein